MRSRSVLQPWVENLTLMQQSVLLAAIRGPDGIRKDHIAKKLSRWLRRCILVTAFDGIVYDIPYDPVHSGWHSGSFTGPSCYQALDWTGDWPSDIKKVFEGKFSVEPGAKIINWPCAPELRKHIFDSWQDAMKEVVRLYLKSCDELPHHYQLHFMHAAEIIGYEHHNAHNATIMNWWYWCYEAIANDMHLNIETRAQMRKRLGDNEITWREAERGVHADV